MYLFNMNEPRQTFFPGFPNADLMNHYESKSKGLSCSCRYPGEVKVTVLKEVSNFRGQMNAPSQYAEFWKSEVINASWFDPEKECVVALNLDTKLKLKAWNLVTLGIVNQALVHPREIFRTAVVMAATHVLVMHNHPSGDVNPSNDDVRSTRRIVQAGRVMGIPCIDHIIIGDRGHFSLKEHGILKFDDDF